MVINNEKKLLDSLLETGEKMLLCGAEITRVEDTIARMAKSYGAVKADVFVITSSIVLTVTFPEDKIYTVTRRIGHDGGTDFIKFEKLNSLSRECCGKNGPIEPCELDSRLKSIGDEKMSTFKGLIGSMLASGSLAVFFGGTLLDGALAALMGAIVWLFSTFIVKLMPNKLTFNLVCSIFVGALICVTQNLTGLFRVDKVAIGVIMLLIPGIAITNAVRDMLVGNTISGTLRFIKSVLLAFMIAAGFMLAIKITGVNATHFATPDGLFQLIPALISSVGFALVFNLRLKYLPYIAFGGLAAWGIYIFFELQFGIGAFWCSLIAGFFADFISQILARIKKTPATLFLVPTFIPLIPGSTLYYASYFLLQNDYKQFGHYVLVTALVVLGMALGIGFSAGLFSMSGQMFNKRKKSN